MGILQQTRFFGLTSVGERWGGYAGFSNFLPDRQQIPKCFRTLGQIPKKGRGVIDGSHPDALLFHPLPVLPGDAVILPDQPHGGNPAQTDDDFGAD